MTIFALVHGGAHGRWCWEQVVPELQRRGHLAIAPDLPIEDDDANLDDWAATVIGQVPDSADADDIVLVGHSMAGLVLPVIAARRPLRRMVFLGAIVPAIGITPLEQHSRQPDMILIDGVADSFEHGELPAHGGDMSWERARHYFYQDVDEAVARRAWRRLRRQSLAVLQRPFPLTFWPDVPATYIVMTDDHSVNPAWSRRYAREVHLPII